MPDKDKTKDGLDRRQLLAGTAAATGAILLTIRPKQALAQDYPSRPITVVVMHGAGGGTDTVSRKIADEIVKATDWDVTVINKVGGIGSLATKYVANQPADGYTLLGGSNFNKFGRTMGHLDADSKSWEDWTFFTSTTSFASWAVNKDSPYQTFQDVVDAAKAKPGELTISTAGSGGLWHEIALIVADFAGIELRFVPYTSGKASTLAGLQGEVDIAGGGIHEQIDFVKSGDLRPLQQTSTEDIIINDTILWPSVGSLLPDLKPFLPVGGFGHYMMRRDTPVEILAAVKEAYIAATATDEFKEWADKSYQVINVNTGEAADKLAAQYETLTVDIFNKYAKQIGQEVKSAEELGLPSPADFESWWPPEGYKPLNF